MRPDHTTRTTPTRPTLRVFAGDGGEQVSQPGTDAGGELTERSTLTQLFEAAFEPLYLRAQALDQQTTQLYRDALQWWVRLTGDPPLREIDEWVTAAFVESLLRQPGRRRETLSVATVRKHCAQLDTLLSFAGPKTRDARGWRNRGILELPPRIERPRADREAPAGDWTLDEVRRMHGAAGFVTAPALPGVTPANWWRAMIVTATHTGLRIGQLLALEYADLSGETLLVRARGSKGRRGKLQHLSSAAAESIESIRTDRRLIFEWPHHRRWLHRCLKRLATCAGIPESRRFGWHGFRRTHATLVAEQSAASGGGVLAAQISLGHTSSATTLGHYVSGRVQHRLAAESIDRLPSPRSTGDPRQKRLAFESVSPSESGGPS